MLPRGCSAAVGSARLVVPEPTEDVAQRGRGHDASKALSAQCGCDTSPGCRVPAHSNQQLKGSMAAAPVFSDSRKYFRSQQILDIFNGAGRVYGFTFRFGYRRPDFFSLFIPRKAGLTQQDQLVCSERCFSVPLKMLKWRQKPKLQFCV